MIDDRLLLEDGPQLPTEVGAQTAYWDVSEDGMYLDEDDRVIDLMESLLEQGKLAPIWVTPVYGGAEKHYGRSVLRYDYILIDGNHRYLAYLYTAHEEINAVIVDYDSEKQEYVEVPDAATEQYVDLTENTDEAIPPTI